MSDLSGLTVLVTRPKHQAQQLSDAIIASGGKTVLFPALSITPLRKVPGDNFDVVIFNSANAVYSGLSDDASFTGDVIAMGPGTQEVLREKNIHAQISAPPYNSESILAMPQFEDLHNKKILIVSGEGGRQLLYAEFKKRGADVTNVAVYKRGMPEVDTRVLDEFWEAKSKIITVTSVETIENLIKMVPDANKTELFETPILVISQRVAKCDAIKPFDKILVSKNAANNAILEALHSWYNE